MNLIHEWAHLQGLQGRAEERVLEWDIHGLQPVPRYLRNEVCWLRQEVAQLAPLAMQSLMASTACNDTGSWGSAAGGR